MLLEEEYDCGWCITDKHMCVVQTECSESPLSWLNSMQACPNVGISSVRNDGVLCGQGFGCLKVLLSKNMHSHGSELHTHALLTFIELLYCQHDQEFKEDVT